MACEQSFNMHITKWFQKQNNELNPSIDSLFLTHFFLSFKPMEKSQSEGNEWRKTDRIEQEKRISEYMIGIGYEKRDAKSEWDAKEIK